MKKKIKPIFQELFDKYAVGNSSTGYAQQAEQLDEALKEYNKILIKGFKKQYGGLDEMIPIREIIWFIETGINKCQ